MTGRKLWGHFETVLIVTLISVLVWLYAEGENVQTYTNQPLVVRFVAAGGQDLAIDPQDVEILATFRASAGEISALATRLRQGPIELLLGQEVDDSPTQTVVLRDALERSEVGAVGINILDTTPVTKVVRAEPLVTRRVPIEPAPTDVQFAGQPRLTPEEVTVRLPRSLAGLTETARVVARLDALDLSSYETNTDVTATVPLELPEGLRSPWTTLTQATVQAQFNIRKLTDSIRLPNIPLRVVTDPLTLQDYDIVLSADAMVLRDVRLTGPADAVEEIVAGRNKPWAYISPSREQIERGAASNAPVMITPVIVVPEGVTADIPEPVSVTIRRR